MILKLIFGLIGLMFLIWGNYIFKQLLKEKDKEWVIIWLGIFIYILLAFVYSYWAYGVAT